MTTLVTVWSENYHELHDPEIARVYPTGIHGAIAEGLNQEHDILARTATQDEPGHGLDEALLDETDVLVWWGHIRQEQVDDAVVERVVNHVRDGMGFIALHSAMQSKVFRQLLGTSCAIEAWRHGDRELMWTVTSDHPIAKGIPNPLIIPAGEMYCEPFDVPQPDEVVLLTSYSGGEALRSCMTFHYRAGRIVYLAPGHEEYPIYYQPEIRRLLANAVRWAEGTEPYHRSAHEIPPAENRPRGWFDTTETTPA